MIYAVIAFIVTLLALAVRAWLAAERCTKVGHQWVHVHGSEWHCTRCSQRFDFDW